VVGEFAEAVKNKRSFDSMQASINEALAALKISYRQRATLLHTNLDTLSERSTRSTAILFSDKAAILTKAPDDFAALVKVRCSEFDSAEAVRVETEKKRIQASAQQAAAAQVQRAHAQTRAALNGADVAVCDQTITTLEAQIFEEEAYGAHCQALAESRDQVLQVARSAREAAVTKTATAVAEAPAPGPAPAPAAAPAAVTTAPAPAVAPSVVALPQRVAPAAGTPPTLSLGKLGTRLGFNLTADFLRSIGFEPAGRERAAVLYHEADFGHICAALVGHIQALQSKQAA
jgi:hypothetical protein